eukprot:6153486-Amphidinium_carterae.1
MTSWSVKNTLYPSDVAGGHAAGTISPPFPTSAFHRLLKLSVRLQSALDSRIIAIFPSLQQKCNFLVVWSLTLIALPSLSILADIETSVDGE